MLKVLGSSLQLGLGKTPEKRLLVRVDNTDFSIRQLPKFLGDIATASKCFEHEQMADPQFRASTITFTALRMGHKLIILSISDFSSVSAIANVAKVASAVVQSLQKYAQFILPYLLLSSSSCSALPFMKAEGPLRDGGSQNIPVRVECAHWL